MRPAVAGTLAVILVAAPAVAQDGLADVAAEAERAWVSHDAARLVGRGPALYLHMPGADPSLPMGRAQAAALLRRYLAAAVELGWEVRAVRAVEPGRGYVEAVRRYTVRGTGDERRETLFLSYRREGMRWVLMELRITP